jgi:hypothetical protein
MLLVRNLMIIQSSFEYHLKLIPIKQFVIQVLIFLGFGFKHINLIIRIIIEHEIFIHLFSLATSTL